MSRRKERVDSVAALGNLDALCASDLAIQFHTGQAFSTGVGRAKTWGYRTGIMCNAGDLEIDAWIEAAKAVVIRDFGETYLDKVSEFVKKNALSSIIRSKQETTVRILDLCLSKDWDNPEWHMQQEFLAKVGTPNK